MFIPAGDLAYFPVKKVEGIIVCSCRLNATCVFDFSYYNSLGCCQEGMPALMIPRIRIYI